MRHRKAGRRFDMNSSQRRAMYRNMATSLLIHGQIRTTEARAKELRRIAERLISIGKRAPSERDLAAASGDGLHRAKADRVTAIRRLDDFLQSQDAVRKVMGEYAERFRSRPGGYTRVVKLARTRPGDKAPMAVIQVVESLSEARPRRAAPVDAPTADAPVDAPLVDAPAPAVPAETEAPVG